MSLLPIGPPTGFLASVLWEASSLQKSPLFCGILPTQCGPVTVYLPGAVKGVLELFPGSLHFILKAFSLLKRRTV